MALGDDLKDIGKDLKDLNDLGTSLGSVFKEIGDGLKDLSKSSSDFSTEISTAAKVSTELAKDAQVLAGINKTTLKNKKEIAKFDQKAVLLSQKRTRLESAINAFKDKLATASEKESKILKRTIERLENQVDYTKQIEQGYQSVLDTTKKISAVNPFKSASEFVGDIPIIGKAFNELATATEKFNDELIESGSTLKALGKGTVELGGLISKIGIGFAIDGVGKFSQAATDLSRNLNISKDAALDLTSAAIDATSAVSGITGDEVIANQIAFGKALGTNAILTQDLAIQFGALTKQVGLSAEAASELTKFGSITADNAEDFTNELIGQVKMQNIANESAIRYQDVLDDVSKTNKATLLSIEGQGKSLGKAAFEAKRLGLSLNQVDNIAGNLLNFEESIAAELEAELLTGRQLNLEKARQAALDGDMATLSAEIAKNVGSAEEFANMNRIQQEAIAKALGMNREELASSLVEQESLAKVAKEYNVSNLAQLKTDKDRISALQEAARQQGKTLTDAEAASILGKEELSRQLQNQSTQEAIAEASKETSLAMGQMVDALVGIGNLESSVQKIANAAQTIAIAMTAVMGLSLLGKFGKLLKMFKGLSKSSKSIAKVFGKDTAKGAEKVTSAIMKGSGRKVSGAAAQAAVKAGTATVAKTGGKSATKVAAKAGAKLGGKTLLKRIPIIGSLVGVGFAVDRALKGDGAGALMELGSAGLGLLDLVAPGVGTGLSLAADAGIAARDLKRAGTITPTATASDFIIQDGKMTKFRKDDVIVGGTNLGGSNPEVISLLERLVSAVENGGTVVLDGQKVGTAMMMGSYQLQ